MDLEYFLEQAHLYYQSKDVESARKTYRHILLHNPRCAQAWNRLGIIAYESGRTEVGIQLVRQALEISSNQPEFLVNLGQMLMKLGKFSEAVQVFQDALEKDPNDLDTIINLGISFTKVGKLEKAIQAYRCAIRIDPEVGATYVCLARVLYARGSLEESIENFRYALKYIPEDVLIYSNLGTVFKENGQFDEAIHMYQKAISINPENAEVQNRLGNVFRECGMFDEAIHAYQKAIDANSKYADSHSNLGTLLLMQGNLKTGWKEHEWRWKSEKFAKNNKRFFPHLLWDGRQLTGKAIAIWSEQGIGDCIMYASLLLRLQQQAQRILVEIEYRLLPIFQRSFPNIDFFLVQNPSHPKLLDSSIDYQSSIGSVARWLLPDEESFPKSPSYLKACADKTGELRDEYQKLAPGKLLIGISWKSVNKDMGKLKSTSLIQWTGLLSRKDCFFINLQYGDVEEEIEAFASQTGISVYQDKGINSLESLDNFSAQVSALDLVISTSNTTVHMAGALGKPVWTLLHYVPDWRWQLDRSDTPWYPSMKLYRQPSLGDWDSVFQQVQSDLAKFIDQTLNAKMSSHA